MEINQEAVGTVEKLSINDFIKSMEAAGFDGTFRAVSGELVINGRIGLKNKVDAVNSVAVDVVKKPSYKNK